MVAYIYFVRSELQMFCVHYCILIITATLGDKCCYYASFITKGTKLREVK